MGRDLYGPFIAMLQWGDRWLSRGKPPLLLKHLSCGHDFHAEVVCDRCKQPIVAADMRYKLAYDPKSFGALGPRSVDLGRLVQRLDQLEAHDLSRTRARDFRNKVGGLGNLVGRQMRPAVIHQRIHIQFVAFRDDEKAWHLAERGVPDADHRAICQRADAG